MMAVGILFIVLGFICFIWILLTKKTKSMVLLAIFSVIDLYSGILICSEENHEKEYKYPASEYHLDYEITMRGEQVDTVYVLTRK